MIDNRKIVQAPTLKQLKAMKKPYPYKEVSDILNSMSKEELIEGMDAVIGKAEVESCSMVGIKKLFKMCKPEVQDLMKRVYGI